MIPSKPRRNRAKRNYHRHGAAVVSKALPFLLERVRDSAVPDEALTLVERGARAWRSAVLQDLAGAEVVPATKAALLNAAVGTWVVLASLDRYLFELAGTGGLVNRRNRRAFAIVADRMRVADSLGRQLQLLGLERRQAPVRTLEEDLAERTEAQAEWESQGQQEAES